MKQIIISIALVFAIFGSTAVSAQALNELINTALANNYQVLILRNEALIASNNNTAGNAGQLPSVGLNGGISTALNNTHQELADGSVKEGNNARTMNMNLALLANWTAFDGFGVYAAKDRLEYLEQLGELNTKFYVEQTIADIVVAYYQLVYENQVLNNFRQSLSISAYRLRIEERKRSVGSGTMLSYGQAQVDYNTDSIRYMSQQNTIALLKIEMNRILANDPEFPVEIADTTFSFSVTPAKDSLLAKTERTNVQLEQQLLNELISETELRMEKAARYPRVNVFAGYQFAQSQAEVGFIQLNQNVGPVIGLNVAFNLYNGGITNTRIENQHIENENAALNSQLTRHNLNAEVLKLYSQYGSLTDRIALAQINVETMQKVYTVAAEQLTKGDINGYDFRLTQLSLLNAQLSLMELQFALKIAEVNLERISGTLLERYM